MSNKKFIQFVESEVKKLKDEGLYNLIRTVESCQGAWIVVNGKKVLNLCSNNYLGLAADQRLRNAAIEGINKYGIGPGAVRSISGNTILHEILEKKLANFKNVEAALCFQSGFNVNIAVIPAIATKEDTIFSDELNHASIIDGCRLSRASVKTFKHGDIQNLEKLLKEDVCGKKIIITDGVFSMDGDIANLSAIVDVAEKYEAIVIVDDAHGEGVLGNKGRGIVDYFDLHGKVDIEIGTMSKAFGCVGGYAAGNLSLINYLKQKARPFLFSSALTIPDVAANIAAIDILEENDNLVKKLWQNANYLKSNLKGLGFNIGNSESPITPVMIGNEEQAAEMSKLLFEQNIFAQSIVYPTVPKGRSRIRVMISAVHTQEDIDYAMEKFAIVGKTLKII